MHRPATRLAGIVACAAVPVALLAGCSSSDSKDTGSASSAASGASGSGASHGSAASSPSVAKAKFAKLPDPCEAISSDTVKKLLPKAKDSAGTQGKSSDTDARGYCSWDSSDSQGVKGTQYRWLDVSFQRYDSEAAIGSGEQRAVEAYGKQVDAEKATDGAKSMDSATVEGIGDAATSVTYDLSKDGSSFKNTTIVARTANAVVTLHYDGAGLAGGKKPDSGDLLKDARAAAQDAVSAIAKAQ